MSHTRTLWWQAGRLAVAVPQSPWQEALWHDSLRHVATLLEPVWPEEYSSGPFTYALGSLALLLYSGPYNDLPHGVTDVTASMLVDAVHDDDPGVEPTIREGLTARGHDLAAAEDRISSLFRLLTTYHPPVCSPMDLPAAEQPRSGTMMQWGTEWAAHALTRAADPVQRPPGPDRNERHPHGIR